MRGDPLWNKEYQPIEEEICQKWGIPDGEVGGERQDRLPAKSGVGPEEKKGGERRRKREWRGSFAERSLYADTESEVFESLRLPMAARSSDAGSCPEFWP